MQILWWSFCVIQIGIPRTYVVVTGTLLLERHILVLKEKCCTPRRSIRSASLRSGFTDRATGCDVEIGSREALTQHRMRGYSGNSSVDGQC